MIGLVFWSSVNLTGNQTIARGVNADVVFWSSVNLTGNQTVYDPGYKDPGFGAVSI